VKTFPYREIINMLQQSNDITLWLCDTMKLFEHFWLATSLLSIYSRIHSNCCWYYSPCSVQCDYTVLLSDLSCCCFCS